MISKKKLGYRLFGLTFSLFRLCPVFRNKTFLIATHDDSPEGNIALAAKAIKRRRPKMRFIYLRNKSEGLKNPFSFFFVKAFHMATSSVILLDDTFLPMAYTPISKKTRVIQLWHGTGTIKRFGPEVERGELQKLAIRGNWRITTFAVNGKRTKKQYAQAFCINPKRIRITGLPRTDLILDRAAMQAKKKEFYAWCRFKHADRYRYILYAPTFRDSEVDKSRITMDIERVMSELPEDVILMLRLHPHVAKALRERGETGGMGDVREHLVASGVEATAQETSTDKRKMIYRVIDVSGYRGVTTLLSVADVLITDYSSIIFEYVVTKKPMIFYAYDLDDFRENGRDFYEPYEDFVPGPVVRDEAGLIREINAAMGEAENRDVYGATEGAAENSRSEEITEAFISDNFKYLDGHAAERIADIAFGTVSRQYARKNRI